VGQFVRDVKRRMRGFLIWGGAVYNLFPELGKGKIFSVRRGIKVSLLLPGDL